MSLQYGRFSVISAPAVSTAGAGHYDVTRANPTPFVIPTIAEAGATAWAINDEIMVSLSNGNIERWIVVGGVPQYRNRTIGQRRYYQTMPLVTNFYPAPNETAGTGDLVELYGAAAGNGMYEAVTINPGEVIWLGRGDPSIIMAERFSVTASYSVTITHAPAAVWMYRLDTPAPVNSDDYTYNRTTRVVTIPAYIPLGTVIEISHHM